MSMLDDLDVSTDITGEEEDRLGGGSALESDVYNMIIEMAYLNVSKNGAKCVHFNFKGDKGSFKETVYFTNRKGEPFYERDGEKHYLPGFNQINSICLLAAQKDLMNVGKTIETKMVPVYDFDERKEIAVSKEVLMDLIGKPIKLGVLKTIENKNKLVGKKYMPTNVKRTFNESDKAFRASDGKTVTEIKAKADDAEFLTKWAVKWKGVDNDKFTPVEGAPGATQSEASNPTPEDLFD